MNTNDLYLEYARVIAMCKGTELEDTPWVCVKFDEYQFDCGRPSFDSPAHLYEFAVAVLEGKPVWVGNRIYAKSPNYDILGGAIVTKTAHGNTVAQFDDGNQIQIDSKENNPEIYFTWTPQQKRTFTLNGGGQLAGYKSGELPCPASPTNDFTQTGFHIDNVPFCFESFEEAVIVKQALVNLLTEARDK